MRSKKVTMNLAGNRLLVCGGRDFTDYPLLCGTLDGLNSGGGATAERESHHSSPVFARYPPTGAGPAVMRADMAAAYLDYRDRGDLARGVSRGEAPPPTGYHGIGRAREPIWSKIAIDNFVESRGVIDSDGSKKQDLASLV